MKICIFITSIVISFYSLSATMIGTTDTNIEISGVIGEKGSMDNVSYSIIGRLFDEVNSGFQNNKKLATLQVLVNDIPLDIPQQEYTELSRVYLSEIKIRYMKMLHDDSMTYIELIIPYGKSAVCTNHEHFKSLRQSKKTLTFNTSGHFLNAKDVGTCKN